MRVLLSELFYSHSRSSIGITLSKDRINGTSENLRVPGLDLLFSVVFGIGRIVRNLIALGLKFLDSGFKLRDRSADIRKFDDIGFRGLRKIAQKGQIVRLLLRVCQVVGKIRENPSCK